MKFIALLRGINVGGRHKLPMAGLRTLLENLGLDDVRTYIQSGNVVFESKSRDRKAISASIGSAIEREFGFTPKIMLLTETELSAAAEANPYPQAKKDPKTLHLYFLESTPKKPDLGKLELLRASSEQFTLSNGVFYLFAPDGIGRSKLAEAVERTLDVPATARNWRTVEKLLEMCND